MPWNIDTLEDLVNRQVSDVETSIEQDVPLLGKSVLRVLSTVQAAGHHEQYQYLGYLSRQLLPDTAESEFLRRHARIWGVIPKDATFSTGPVSFSGSDGAAILAGTALLGLNRFEYEVTASGTITGGQVTLSVRSREAGAVGNLPEGTRLTLISAIPGVDGAAIVQPPGISGGFEEESDEDLLDRLLERIQNPPQGGAESDYIIWAREVPGVTRAWTIPFHMGPGTLGLLFALDNAADRIPDAAKVAEVQAYLDDRNRRPIGARPVVFAPARRVVDFSLSVEPDTPEIRAAIENDLRDYLPTVGEPGVLLALSELSARISAVPGESRHEILAPADSIQVQSTELLELGAIAWL